MIISHDHEAVRFIAKLRIQIVIGRINVENITHTVRNIIYI